MYVDKKKVKMDINWINLGKAFFLNIFLWYQGYSSKKSNWFIVFLNIADY